MKKKHYLEQSWVKTWNLWSRYEMCLDYMSIMYDKSWGHDNSIKKEINDK